MSSPSRWSRRSAALAIVGACLALVAWQAPRPATSVHVYAGLVCSGATISDLTPGTLTLVSTLQSIGATAAFTGDATATGTAALQYRQAGTTPWINAYAPYIDRRATLGGVANIHLKEARGRIVGLTENTAYDVKVTWTDGGASSCVASGTPITTQTSAPPAGSGTARSITDNATQATALAAANPGDTLTWSAGSYNAFTFSRSGTAGAWITLDGGGVATISGVGVTQNIQLSANYVVLKNFILSASDFSGVKTPSNVHDLVVSGNTLQNVSARCADGPTTTHYGDAGILLGSSAARVLVLSNSITSTSLQACIQSPPYNGPGTGISWTTISDTTIKGNTVTGAFRDAISVDDSVDEVANVEVAANTVTNYVDDGIEVKGSNLSVALWGNIISSTQADTCIATNDNGATNQYGPLYVFRNTCRITGTLIAGGGAIFKSNGSGAGMVPTYYFHNSMDASSAGAGWTGYWLDTTDAIGTAYNNILRVSESLIVSGFTGCVFDRNVSTAGVSWAYRWNGGTSYVTLANFRAGTNQDLNSLSTDPLFADTALHLQATSPAIDLGLLLDNFNTADSAWPLLGTRPDAGAYEKQ